MSWRGLCFILAIVCGAHASAASWMDESYEVFLSGKLKRAVTNYRDYPVFWWNFFIFEKGASAGDAQAAAERVCAQIGSTKLKGIGKLPCYFTADAMGEFAQSWLADTALRRDFPGAAEFMTEYSATLGKAALPLPREILKWLRMDPLDELNALKKLLQDKPTGKFEARGAYLYEPESGRVLMPVQFDFPPTHSSESRQVANAIEKLCSEDGACTGVTLFGPHAGSMENEFQVREDVGTVSLVGTLSLLALVAFIIWSRRYPLLYLLPIMGVTLALSAVATVAVFGSIHAISLSFGPGLVGLAMDYGIHAAFLDPRSKHTWRSNFMALITSLVIMILLGFSSIPLLRQMMFFGALGLTLTYFAFYFVMIRYPDAFTVSSFDIRPRPSRALEVVSLICLLGAGAVFMHPLRLDLKNLSYESPKTAELNPWFFKQAKEGVPYTLPETPEVGKWARDNGIRYEGAGNLLPSQDEQERHLNTWRKPCADGLFKSGTQAAKFFAPFEQTVCQRLQARPLTLPAPAYLADFTNGQTWTAVLFPANEQQTAAIHARFPAASSPRELIGEFPKTFATELGWMLPVSLLGALIFLFFHYRRLSLALLAYVPFLTGVGAFALMAWPLQLPLTFVSLAGLLLVFGFSLDYGIFAVDYMLEPTRERAGVWSALTICAVTTTAGFAPMAMGQHPVLHNLGHALLWGSIGTFVGTFWAVPAGFRLLFGKKTVTA